MEQENLSKENIVAEGDRPTFAQRHQKTQWNINTKDFTFVSLKDLLSACPDRNNRFNLKGLYVNNKGQFGPHPVFIIEGYLVDMPKHLLEETKEILAEGIDIDDIKDGNVFFKVVEYEKNGSKYSSIRWVD